MKKNTSLKLWDKQMISSIHMVCVKWYVMNMTHNDKIIMRKFEQWPCLPWLWFHTLLPTTNICTESYKYQIEQQQPTQPTKEKHTNKRSKQDSKDSNIKHSTTLQQRKGEEVRTKQDRDAIKRWDDEITVWFGFRWGSESCDEKVNAKDRRCCYSIVQHPFPELDLFSCCWGSDAGLSCFLRACTNSCCTASSLTKGNAS